MSGHTPGPWSVGALKQDGDPRLRCWSVRVSVGEPHNQGNTVAEVYGASLTGTENVSANARLIAAAPDLLAALKEAVASWDLAIEDEDAQPEDGDPLAEWKAAIAKAEGGHRVEARVTAAGRCRRRPHAAGEGRPRRLTVGPRRSPAGGGQLRPEDAVNSNGNARPEPIWGGEKGMKQDMTKGAESVVTVADLSKVLRSLVLGCGDGIVSVENKPVWLSAADIAAYEAGYKMGQDIGKRLNVQPARPLPKKVSS